MGRTPGVAIPLALSRQPRDKVRNREMGYIDRFALRCLDRRRKNRFFSARVRQKAVDNLQFMENMLHRRPFPLWAYILITRKCNLSCSYCYVTEAKLKEMGLDTASDDMSLAQLKQAIDKLYDLGTRWISFFGGEPTVRRKELLGSVDYASNNKRMYTQLATNGVLLRDKSYVDDLGRAGIDLIDVSLDSLGIFPESKKDMYHRGSLFDVLFEARERHGFSIKTNFVLTKANVDQLEPVMEFADQNNIMISIRPALPPPIQPSNWKKQDGLYFDNTQHDIRLFDDVVDRILAKKERGYVTCEPNEFYKAMKKNVRGESGFWNCDAGKYHITIDSDGRVMQCAVLLDRLNMNVMDLDVDFFERIEPEVKSKLAICNDNCLAAAYFTAQNYRKHPMSIFQQGFL